jgi:cytochrome d ubiquinol oxidase subunit I
VEDLALLLARWQFGIVTVYHWLFVPITLGITWMVAIMETSWLRTKNPVYLRMTKFWGKLMLINFAIGVVTGIVQEFQFGMNWSTYSRFVGDIFGAPLAIEALLAFFIESTFLGLWIFGWKKLSPKVHVFTIWMVAFGTMASAFWILVAGSWMQFPVGYVLNPATGRAEMDNFLEIITSKMVWAQFPHTILVGVATAGALMLGVSAWHLKRKQHLEVMRKSAAFAAVALLVGSLGVALTGHWLGQVMVEVQPMKMAAAEALWEDEQPAAFSLFAVGDKENNRNAVNMSIPAGLSLLSCSNLDCEVRGINSLQAEMVEEHGPGDYIPNLFVTYWGFRLMVGSGTLMILIGALGVWFHLKGTIVKRRWFLTVALWIGIAAAFLGNATGWIFTELGRQPWVVYEVLLTKGTNSPTVPAGWVWISLIGFTVLYAILAVPAVYLFVKFAKAGPGEETSNEDVAASMVY